MKVTTEQIFASPKNAKTTFTHGSRNLSLHNKRLLRFFTHYSHYSFFDQRVPGYSQVVVGAPNSHRPLAPGELFRLRERVRRPQHLLENSVGVVHLFLRDLLLEEGLVGERLLCSI